MRKILLNEPQMEFMHLKERFTLFCGGVGSGKTTVACIYLLSIHEQWPGTRTGYFAPTYKLISLVFWPTIVAAAELFGYDVQIKRSFGEVHLYRGTDYMGCIICISLDRANTLTGFEISSGVCDELDTLSFDKAEAAWIRIVSRLRLREPGLRHRLAVTTTPESFNFAYKRWVQLESSEYSMVTASTLDNEENLPSGFINSLFETYSQAQAEAHIYGKFVNMGVGRVYHEFCRHRNNTDAMALPLERLFIGMDFNVANCNAVVSVERQGDPLIVNEITSILDTPTMIKTIREKYPDHPTIFIYPDSTGASRTTIGASKSDIRMLRDAGFEVRAKSQNPRIRDRINSLNTLFCNANGRRRLRVNVKNCPKLTECLEMQGFDDNQMPEKGVFDHLNDALGYLCTGKYGLLAPITRTYEL